MSILRNELPQLLDVKSMIEALINPESQIKTPARLVKSARTKLFDDYLITESNLTQKEALLSNQLSPSLLFNVQTNDGTNCVYYPNGQIAIMSTTVFGFFIDNLTVNGSNPDSKSNNTEKGLNWHNIKNSFTTIIYDMTEIQRKSIRNKSPLSSVTNPISISTSNQENISYSSINETLFNKCNNSNNNKKSNEQKILAFITSSGHCVCYRKNGTPK
jgi:hypothetical protein